MAILTFLCRNMTDHKETYWYCSPSLDYKSEIDYKQVALRLFHDGFETMLNKMECVQSKCGGCL